MVSALSRILIGIAAAMLCAAAFVLAGKTLLVDHGERGRASSARLSVVAKQPTALPCSARPVATIAKITRSMATGSPDMVSAVSGGGAHADSDLQIVLPGHSAEGVRVYSLLAASARPDLHSCDMLLADSPGARQLADLATTAWIKSGLATAGDVGAPSVSWLVSDDPTRQGHVFVSALEPTKYSESDVQNGPSRGFGRVLMADVDISTGQVIDSGYANWYAGQ